MVGIMHRKNEKAFRLLELRRKCERPHLEGFSVFALKQKMRSLLLQRILEAGGSAGTG